MSGEWVGVWQGVTNGSMGSMGSCNIKPTLGAVAVAGACRRGCRNMPVLAVIFAVGSQERAMDETVRKIRHV